MRDGSPGRWHMLRRRLVTIPRSVAMLVGLIVLSPILIPTAAAIDGARWLVTRRPAMTLRLMAFGVVFFASELEGLASLAVSWFRHGFGSDKDAMREDAWAVQVRWSRRLMAGVAKIFRIDLRVSGLPLVGPGPVIAIFRHASIVDNLLPLVLLTDQSQIKLRWVLKRELLTLPSLDVAGNRLPNYFVDRNAPDTRAELRGIQALSENLGPNDGVLIYPEGTRFTPERRRRALTRMRQAGDKRLHRAEALRYVMPPRPGGTLALLDSGADVVVGAHHGLEGFAKLGDLWAGGLVGKTVEVELTRIAASDIPRSRRERVDWLYDIWAGIDNWISEKMAGDP